MRNGSEMADDFTQLAFDAGAVFTPGAPINERDLSPGELIK
jgi:hypothetical protein